MTDSRSKLAIWNYATYLLFTIATLSVGLFSSPLIEGWVGPERFGAFRSLTDCFGYLSLLQLGLGGAMGPALARALARGDRRAVHDLMSVGIRAYLAVAALGVVVGLGLTIGIEWLVPVSRVAQVDLRLAYVVGLVGLLALPLAPFRFLAEAQQRGYRINILLTSQAVGAVSLAMVLTQRFPHWGITGQALATAVAALAFGMAIGCTCLRQDPVLFEGVVKARPGREAWREVWSLSWPSLLLMLGGHVSYQSDNLILGKIFGLEMVTVLFFTQRLAVLGQAQLSSIGVACWAGLAELYNRGDHGRFRHQILELSRLVSLLGMAGLGPIVAYDRHFVTLWKGADYFGGDLIILVASINALAMSLISLSGSCLVGTGRIRLLAAPGLLFAVVNLTLSILLTRRVGLVGPLLGTMFSALILHFPHRVYLLRREFGISPSRLVVAVGVPASIGVAYFGLFWWLARVHTPEGWLGLAVEAAASSAGFLALGYAAFFSPAERAAWRNRLARAANIAS